MRVDGFCPACGLVSLVAVGEYNEALRHDAAGYLRCSSVECPDPMAATKILSDGETEHIVTLTGSSFSVLHPLRERLSHELLSCPLGAWLGSLEGPPYPPGEYRVKPRSGDRRAPWTFEALS